MSDSNFTTAFLVGRTPEEAYAAINDVRGWWSTDLDGDTHQVGDEFTYRHGEVHLSRQRVTELVPSRRVAWHVLDASLSFATPPDEWKGTNIVFDVTQRGDQTEVRLTHLGLVPEVECFEQCSQGWRFYFNGSLRALIETGTGRPDQPQRTT